MAAAAADDDALAAEDLALEATPFADDTALDATWNGLISIVQLGEREEWNVLLLED